jgi:hypothetical protein
MWLDQRLTLSLSDDTSDAFVVSSATDGFVAGVVTVVDCLSTAAAAGVITGLGDRFAMLLHSAG